MPRILHHINDIDQHLATRQDFKVQLLILIRLIHHHQACYGQLEPLQTLCTLAKTAYTTIIRSQQYFTDYEPWCGFSYQQSTRKNNYRTHQNHSRHWKLYTRRRQTSSNQPQTTTPTRLWNNIHVAIRTGQLIKNQINSKIQFLQCTPLARTYSKEPIKDNNLITPNWLRGTILTQEKGTGGTKTGVKSWSKSDKEKPEPKTKPGRLTRHRKGLSKPSSHWLHL